MSDSKKLKIFTGVVLGVMIGASVFLAMAFIYKDNGDINFGIGVIIAIAMVGGALLSYVYSIWKTKQSNNIPEIDERTIFVLKNYFMYALYFLIVISGIITFVLFFLDVKTIEIESLFIYQMIMYLCIGVGAMIAKKVG